MKLKHFSALVHELNSSVGRSVHKVHVPIRNPTMASKPKRIAILSTENNRNRKKTRLRSLGLATFTGSILSSVRTNKNIP